MQRAWLRLTCRTNYGTLHVICISLSSIDIGASSSTGICICAPLGCDTQHRTCTPQRRRIFYIHENAKSTGSQKQHEIFAIWIRSSRNRDSQAQASMSRSCRSVYIHEDQKPTNLSAEFHKECVAFRQTEVRIETHKHKASMSTSRRAFYIHESPKPTLSIEYQRGLSGGQDSLE